MPISEELKNEIRNSILEQEKSRIEFQKEVQDYVKIYLNQPGRELTENEKLLIKEKTNYYNWFYTLLSIIGIGSLITIFAVYSNAQDDRLNNQVDTTIFNIEKSRIEYENFISKRINSVTDSNIKKINDYFNEKNKGFEELVNEVSNEKDELHDNMIKFRVYNSQVQNGIDYLDQEMPKLESSKKEVEITLDSARQLQSKLKNQQKEIKELAKESDILKAVLENSTSQLVVTEYGKDNYMEVGQLFFQWGSDTTSNDGKGFIELQGKVNNVNDYSISIVGENLRYNSFPVIEHATKSSITIMLWNDGTFSDKFQKYAPYRYLIIGKIAGSIKDD